MFEFLFTTAVVSLRSSREHQGTSDADLVTRLRAGERQAARELWDEQVSRVRSVVWAIVGQSADVDDLVQEVFIEVLKGVRNIRDTSALDGFVRGVAANVCRNYLRRRAKRRAQERVRRSYLTQRVVHPDPEARLALQRLDEILDDLSVDLRMAFALRYLQALELTQVAAALGWSLATTKRRIRKARTVVLARAERDPRLARYVSEDVP